jgi:hypothetical protein
MEQHIIYVGLDVHKDTIAAAFAEAGKRGEVREHGKVLNTPAAQAVRSSAPPAISFHFRQGRSGAASNRF